MTLKMIECPSPNFGPRNAVDGETRVRHVVVHYTGMKSWADAKQRLCDSKAEVSAHYAIDEDGSVYRLVPEDMRAWHAGKAFWRGVRDINSTSIGIELVNPGHENGYRAFPDVQIAAFAELVSGIMQRHSVSAADILGHSDVAPGRKDDPGELFPWKSLAEQGIGLWPEETVVLPGNPDLASAFRRLSEIGYAVPLRDELGMDMLSRETATIDVITAFQRRYRPADVTGVLDNETATLLAAVDVAFAKARTR